MAPGIGMDIGCRLIFRGRDKDGTCVAVAGNPRCRIRGVFARNALYKSTIYITLHYVVRPGRDTAATGTTYCPRATLHK